MRLFKFSIKPNSIQWLLSELIIVVLGILIAFQVEEYRQYLNDRKEEITLLVFFQNDLIGRKSSLEKYIETREESNNAIKDFIELTKKEPAVSANSFIDIRRQIVTNWLWRPSRARSMGLLESKQLDLIQDHQLKEQLITYYNLFEPYYSDLIEPHRVDIDFAGALLSRTFYYYPDETFMIDGKRIIKPKSDSLSQTELDEIINALMVLYDRNNFVIRRGNNLNKLEELSASLEQYLAILE